MELRRCCTCKKPRPLKEFGKDASKVDGLNVRCKSCCQNSVRGHVQKYPEKERARCRTYKQKHREDILLKHKAYKIANPQIRRAWYLKKYYGLTLEDYEQMVQKQQGRCAVCNKTNSNRKNKRLCVDHDHVTGRVRGLLCTKCNQMLGQYTDDVLVFERFVAYLRTGGPFNG